MGPEQLGNYVLDERIAVGGMAEVFRASRTGPQGFQKQVAIKKVLPHFAKDPQLVAMFFKEARLSARLCSDHLIEVFDFGEVHGEFFLAMEYVDGLDLSALLATCTSLDVEIAAFVAKELCLGLIDLHAASDEKGNPLVVAHRDVTPGNVLISKKGHVKLGDFGIAKSRAQGSLTQAGTLKGKLAYLSPEQARGEHVDERCDVYGVGLTLYEALTGQRYNNADTEQAFLDQAKHPNFVAPSSLFPKLPGELDALLQRCLEPQPEKRFPTAKALHKALEQFCTNDTQSKTKLANLVYQADGSSQANEDVGDHAAKASEPVLLAENRLSKRTQPSTEVLKKDYLDQAPRNFKWTLLVLSGISLTLLAIFVWQYETRQTFSVQETSLSSSSSKTLQAKKNDLRKALGTTSNQQAGKAGSDTHSVKRTHHPEEAPKAPVVSPVPGKNDATPLAKNMAKQVESKLSPNPMDFAPIESLFQKRGLLPADVPLLHAKFISLRTKNKKGMDIGAELDALAEEIQEFVIDRSFLDSKLSRLDRQLLQLELDPGKKQHARSRIQEALSFAVAGRYDQANHELNKVIQLLE